MDGILSSFGFSSKKRLKEDKGSNNGPAATSSTEHTQENPDQDGNLTLGSKDQPTNDRNPNMRLSKNTPSKLEENEFEIPSEPSVPSFNSNVIASRSAPAEERSPSAVIGPKITFKGELTGEEDLLIQGTVEGTIDLKGNQLTVGKQGTVRANLMAKTIIIEGTVEGDLIGQERIEIKSSSNVKGNLVADRVTLEDGAKFRGSIDMDNKGAGSNKYSAGATSSTPSNKPEKV